MNVSELPKERMHDVWWRTRVQRGEYIRAEDELWGYAYRYEGTITACVHDAQTVRFVCAPVFLFYEGYVEREHWLDGPYWEKQSDLPEGNIGQVEICISDRLVMPYGTADRIYQGERQRMPVYHFADAAHDYYLTLRSEGGGGI